MKISDIQHPVGQELGKFEPFFRQHLQSPVPLLSSITNHICRSKGKRLRPLLVFLSAKLNGEICQKTYAGAAMMELLHTATLMHDDVVDDADKRRNSLSIKALWDSKKAILAG
ncbi:MAG: polyprenyl synthetase family protein, partial [Prevotellaceae bacterium]|nr:polyprenyl synthetase family protein [Prevotellaceae bacterium]